MQSDYSKHAQQVLSIASRRAEAAASPHVGKEHVALALFDYAKGFASDAMVEISLPIPAIYEELHVAAEKKNDTTEQEESNIIEKFEEVAQRYQSDYIGTEHLLIAILELGSPLNDWVQQSPVTCEDFIAYLGGEKESLDFPEDGAAVVMGGSRLQVSKDTSILATYGTNLTELYLNGEGNPVIGRDDEIDRAIKILCRKTKNNPLLIGEAGVGKTAIAEGIAQRIANDDVPLELKGAQIVCIDIFAMLGGTMFRGQFEDKITNLMKEVESFFGNVILFIDEIHNIVGAGASNSEESGDLSNILKPALSRGELSCIGATTVDEYKKYIEKDAALERRFQRIFIDEPNHQNTFKILKGIRSSYCEYHNVSISNQVLQYIIEVCSKMEDRRFPDKAIDLLDEACVEAHIEASGKVPHELIEKDKEMDRLIVNAIQSSRAGEDDYFISKKLEIIKETEKKTKGRVSKKHINKIMSDRKYDPTAGRRVGFGK